MLDEKEGWLVDGSQFQFIGLMHQQIFTSEASLSNDEGNPPDNASYCLIATRRSLNHTLPNIFHFGVMNCEAKIQSLCIYESKSSSNYYSFAYLIIAVLLMINCLLFFLHYGFLK